MIFWLLKLTTKKPFRTNVKNLAWALARVFAKKVETDCAAPTAVASFFAFVNIVAAFVAKRVFSKAVLFSRFKICNTES